MALEAFTRTFQTPSQASYITDLISKYEASAAAVTKSQQAREAESRAIYDKIIAMYGEGGLYGRGYLEQLRGEKVRDVGKATQAGISRGLYGLRDYGAEWESTVGEPARLKLEDIKMERLSSALAAKAGFVSSISQQYPDYSALQQAIQSAASAGGGYGGGGRSTTFEEGFSQEPLQSYREQMAGGAGGYGYGGEGGGAELQMGQGTAASLIRGTPGGYGTAGTYVYGGTSEEEEWQNFVEAGMGGEYVGGGVYGSLEALYGPYGAVKESSGYTPGAGVGYMPPPNLQYLAAGKEGSGYYDTTLGKRILDVKGKPVSKAGTFVSGGSFGGGYGYGI